MREEYHFELIKYLEGDAFLLSDDVVGSVDLQVDLEGFEGALEQFEVSEL